MTEYSILSLLPNYIQDYHQALRLKIERQFHLGGPTVFPVPSHVTLKYRFPVEDMAELEGVLQEYSRFQGKTEWSLQGFDCFENPDNFVIFIKVVPSQPMREAHARLLAALGRIAWMQWGPYDHANLHYHVTLASKGLTSENFADVWAFVTQQPSPNWALSLDNLALLQLGEEGPKICQQYRLR